jgi:hypothetical protein
MASINCWHWSSRRERQQQGQRPLNNRIADRYAPYTVQASARYGTISVSSTLGCE